MLALRSYLILLMMLAACVASDEVNIVVSGMEVTDDVRGKVETLLRINAFREIRYEPNVYHDGQRKHFVNDDYLNVFVQDLNQQSLNIKFIVAGRGNFSDPQIKVIRSLLIVLRKNIGSQNVISDTHTKSGQKLER